MRHPTNNFRALLIGLPAFAALLPPARAQNSILPVPSVASVAGLTAALAGKQPDLKYVTLESFGAKGDGVTDDTAAIQAALNSGSPIKMLRKTYCFTQITAKVNSVLEGTGIASQLLCTLQAPTGATASTIPYAIDFTNITGCHWHNFRITNKNKIPAANASATNWDPNWTASAAPPVDNTSDTGWVNGFKFANCYSNFLDEVPVEYFNRGMDFIGIAGDNMVSKSYFNQCWMGVGSSTAQNYLSQCTIASCVRGVNLTGNQGTLTLIHTTISAPAATGNCYAGVTATGAGTSVSLYGSWVEQCRNCVMVESGGTMASLGIHDCLLSELCSPSDTTGATGRVVNLTAGYGEVSITGCQTGVIGGSPAAGTYLPTTFSIAGDYAGSISSTLSLSPSVIVYNVPPLVTVRTHASLDMGQVPILGGSASQPLVLGSGPRNTTGYGIFLQANKTVAGVTTPFTTFAVVGDRTATPSNQFNAPINFNNQTVTNLVIPGQGILVDSAASGSASYAFNQTYNRLRFTAPLTGHRGINFYSTAALPGQTFRVTRDAAATGTSFAVYVTDQANGGVTVLNMYTPGTWADFTWDGTHLFESAGGTLL